MKNKKPIKNKYVNNTEITLAVCSIYYKWEKIETKIPAYKAIIGSTGQLVREKSVSKPSNHQAQHHCLQGWGVTEYM